MDTRQNNRGQLGRGRNAIMQKTLPIQKYFRWTERWTDGWSNALAPNHELFANLSTAMLKIHQNGKINDVFEQYEKYQSPQETSNEQTPQPLHPKDIAGLFAVVIIKLILAVVWAISKKWKKLRGNQTRLNTITSV